MVLEPKLHEPYGNLNGKIFEGIAKRLKGEYKLKIEERDKHEMRILDFRALKLGSKLHFTPYLKPVYAQYITPSSGHPRFIHSSWPLGNMRRIGELASIPELFEGPKQRLLDRYKHCGLLQSVVAEASQYDPFRMHVEISGLPGTAVGPQEDGKHKDVWSSVRFHPIFEKAGLRRTSEQTRDKWRHSGPRELAITRVAWKNHGPPLQAILKKLHKGSCRTF